jgi:hypothetical protein
LNDEAREFQWVTLEEALKLPLNQPTRNLVLALDGSTQETAKHG